MHNKVLLFIFDAMKLVLLNHLPNSSLKIEGDTFEDIYKNEIESTSYDGFLGFYDWLIKSNNEVIGVYLALSDFSEGLADFVDKYDNVEVEEDRLGLFIFFSSERDYNNELSCSQSFGCNKIYRSDSGKFAMSFGLPEYSLNKILGLAMS